MTDSTTERLHELEAKRKRLGRKYAANTAGICNECGKNYVVEWYDDDRGEGHWGPGGCLNCLDAEIADLRLSLCTICDGPLNSELKCGPCDLENAMDAGEMEGGG